MSASALSLGSNGDSSLSFSSVTAKIGYHLLKIDGYSLTKLIPYRGHIKSCSFHAAGYNWHINYYPNGSGRPDSFVLEPAHEYVSLYLILDDTVTEAVRVQIKFSILNHAGEPVLSTTRVSPMQYLAVSKGWCCWNFIKRADLERPELVGNDCFTIRCDIVVVNEFLTVEPHHVEVPVPPSDLHRHFGELLSSEVGADVTFKFDGETFKAHRCVLIARSSVFEAKLLGSMKEGTSNCTIHIEEMEARVFKAVLYFIYTDMLPEMGAQEESCMLQHLLEAADRFNLERLKLMCEGKLCKHIDADSVTTTLVLAEQHNCQGLKEVCFEFLKSPTNLSAAMVDDGFDHLISSCPSVLKELMSKLALH